MADKVIKSDAEWKRELTPEQYRVMRKHGTERAFTGQYHDCKDDGVYRCAGCGNPLFSSDTKFDSGTGWPSFWAPIQPGAVEFHEDGAWLMRRTEVTCARCGGHLGHVPAGVSEHVSRRVHRPVRRHGAAVGGCRLVRDVAPRTEGDPCGPDGDVENRVGVRCQTSVVSSQSSVPSN